MGPCGLARAGGHWAQALDASEAAPRGNNSITLGLKIAQKPAIVWPLSPKALNFESLEPKGWGFIEFCQV